MTPSEAFATSTLTALLMDPVLAADSAAPRVTFYDDATGERIELSAVTLMNWAAKTANLLRDECDAVPGSRVRVLLPAHWQTAAVLLGCWWAGCEVLMGSTGGPGTESGGAEPVQAAFIPEDPGDSADYGAGDADDGSLDEGDAEELLVLSLDPFGRPASALPTGAIDYATEVRMHGDQFRPEPLAPSAPALDGRSVAEVMEAARAEAERTGLTAADRVLSSRGWGDVEALIAGLAAPLAAGASLVQVAHPDTSDDAVERRIAAEKVTRVL